MKNIKTKEPKLIFTGNSAEHVKNAKKNLKIVIDNIMIYRGYNFTKDHSKCAITALMKFPNFNLRTGLSGNMGCAYKEVEKIMRQDRELFSYEQAYRFTKQVNPKFTDDSVQSYLKLFS